MNRLRLFLLSYFLILMISSVKGNQIDSLKSIYNKSGNDSERLETLDRLNLILTDETDQKLYLIKQLSLAERFKKYEMTAEILGNLGWHKYAAGEFLTADSLYRKSIEISKKYGYIRQEGKIYTCMMMLNWFQGKTEEAVKFFEKSEQILKKLNDNKGLSNLYLNASELYKYIAMPEKSLYCAQQSFEYAKKSDDSTQITGSAAFLGDAYRDNGNGDSSINILNYAFALAEKRNDEYNKADICYFICLYYFDKGDYINSLKYAGEARAISTKLNNADRVSHINQVLVDIYFFMGDFSKSKNILLIEKKHMTKDNIMSGRYIYRQLANIDLTNRDIKSFRKNTAIADSLEELFTSDKVRKSVLEINTKYETSLKEKEITELQQQKKISEIFITALCISLATILIAAFFTYRFINQKKIITEQENIQLKQERTLTAMTNILKVQEEERGRVAKDLHDGLGGMLSGIKLNLSSMKGNIILQEKEFQLFNKSIHQLDNAIEEMRRVAHNMMPEALLKFGLDEAIKDFCDAINESNVIKISYSNLGLYIPLEKSTEIIFFRIIQELTNNALKHSQAKNIFIQLTIHDHGLILTIEDDGKGFDKKQLEEISGAGLKNVKSRVDYLKGNMDIQSAIGTGTSINIEIPL